MLAKSASPRDYQLQPNSPLASSTMSSHNHQHSSMSSIPSFASSKSKAAEPFIPSYTYWSSWLCFFILGTCNNFICVVILSSAKNLADAFDASHLIGLVSWSLTIFSLVTQTLNTLCLQRLTHYTRILGTVVSTIVALVGFSLSLYWTGNTYVHNFIFVLLCLVLLGGTSSFGQNVCVGFLKLFPANLKLSGAWSSGTGFAGLFGSGLYLLLSSVLRLPDKLIYVSLLPSMIFYVMAFLVMNRSSLQTVETNDLLQPMLQQQSLRNDCDRESMCRQIWRCYKLCFYRAWMMALVYFFEYVISTGLASVCNTNLSVPRQNNIFVYLSVCYQIGVFISRSSIGLFQLDCFGVLACLQGLNFVLWHTQCYLLWMSTYCGVWMEYACMVYVGFLGGFMYVNVLHHILSDTERIHNQTDRELCLNIVLIHIVLGMILSSIYTLIIDNTVFAELVAKSD